MGNLPARSITIVLSLPDGKPRLGTTVTPLAARIAHLERGRRGGDGFLLREGDVDARVGGIDPTAEEEPTVRTAGVGAEVHDEIVRLDDALIARGDEVRHVDVVARSQRGEHVGAALVDGGARELARADVKETQLHRARRHEGLVDEHVDRVGVIDGDELHFVGVRRLPQLFGELEQVASVARLQCIAGDAEIFLRRARRREGGAASHQAERHAERTAPHRVGHEAEALPVPRVREGAGSLEQLLLDDALVVTGQEHRLRHAVGPFDAQDIRLEMRAEPEVDATRGGDAGLIEIARAELQARADAEPVVLAAPGAERLELDVQRRGCCSPARCAADVVRRRRR